MVSLKAAAARICHLADLSCRRRLGLVLVVYSLAVPPLPAFGASVEQTLAILRAANPDRITELFQYFPEAVGPNEARKDRDVVRSFLALMYKHFGRPQDFRSIGKTTKTFVNVFVESANADVWRNSACLFKSHAFATNFVDGTYRAPAEWLIDFCVDTNGKTIGLRKIDVHFTNPAPDTVARAQSFFKAFQEEVKRIRGSRAT